MKKRKNLRVTEQAARPVWSWGLGADPMSPKGPRRMEERREGEKNVIADENEQGRAHISTLPNSPSPLSIQTKNWANNAFYINLRNPPSPSPDLFHFRFFSSTSNIQHIHHLFSLP